MNVELDIYEATIAKLPWGDSKKWTPGEWYPMPLGFMERDEPDWIVAGYGVFEQIDPNGDIGGTLPGMFTFGTALKLCEEHNGRTMLK